MKLLVVTQAVDRTDPVLGFFHGWLREFSKHAESIEVICLRAGNYDLPVNVHVHALGRGKLNRALKFVRLCWSLRSRYDAVFVHMNPEYVVLAGWLWRLLGKRVALWYTHKSVDLKLRVAAIFAQLLMTASKESFRIASPKVRVMGHGIDTDFFTADPDVLRGEHWLSVGRLSPSKRHDRVIQEAALARVPVRIVGIGSEQASLEKRAEEAHANVAFLGALGPEALREEYRRARQLTHRSETGSLDKVVLEAAACGCAVDTTDPALASLPLSPSYVRTHHSLTQLIPRIIAALT